MGPRGKYDFDPEKANCSSGGMTVAPADINDPQALIAALRAELDAALAGQAALAEVMELIKRNPGNPAPVFDAVLRGVLRLSNSAFGALHSYDDELVRTIAVQGAGMLPIGALQAFPVDPGTLQHRIVLGEDIASLADIRDDDAYRNRVPSRVRAADVHGARTQLMAGLRKDGKLLGFINIFRTEVEPFTDAQIGLVKAFAAQAVIAMENARLLTEQREALEQQTATAEVLQVINASPGDLQPVFDAMLEKAMRLCGAAFGMLKHYDGELGRMMAMRGVPQALADHNAQHAVTPLGPLLQALQTGKPFQTLDVRKLDLHKVRRRGDPRHRRPWRRTHHPQRAAVQGSGFDRLLHAVSPACPRLHGQADRACGRALRRKR